MLRWRIGIAVVLLATLLSSEALARMRLGGPIGVARFAVARVLSLGRVHHARGHARHGYVRTAALRPQNIRRAMDSGPADPAARRQIVAVAALAGWSSGRTSNGWWRHNDGGYGWVGPLFWPFAVYDIHDYAVLGDGGFWDYGYPDIHAAIFAPYSRDELAAYAAPGPSGRRHRRTPPLLQLCGDDSQEVGGRLVGQLQQAMQPNNEAQRAALDDLAKALITAAEMIRASCPAQAALTAPERLAVMQRRIGTMVMAEQALQQPLAKFYDLLDDEQEARLIGLADDRRKISPANADPETSAQGCDPAQPAALQWPANEIESRLHPNEAQRTALKALQEASARAIDILSACRPQDATTPPARLDAVEGRLDAMQQAVYLVSAALAEFYATLSDEQKMQFEAIGQKRTA